MKKEVILNLKSGVVKIEFIRENIVKCIYSKREIKEQESLIIEKKEYEEISFTQEEQEHKITLGTSEILLTIDLETEQFIWWNKKSDTVYLKEAGKVLTETDIIRYTTGNEKPVIERVKTVDGERNFIQNLKPVIDRKGYRGKLCFSFDDAEGIFGLGQGEEGIYNYRHHTQYLYQHNMRIPIPFFVSTKQYGILADCCSLMTFQDDERGSYLYMDAIDQMEYYFIGGQKLDDVIDGYRYLTGQAVLLPKWAFGYIQSKEAYHTQEELVETVARYRELGVGLDCIVQDWNTWEDGKWGEKKVDKHRYPNLSAAMEEIHKMKVHTMVSVWPNMNPGGENHMEFFKAGLLLHDYSTYNAFSEEARALFWKQAGEELFSGGFDSWWCDSTEPFSGPDWSGEEIREPWERFLLVGTEHKKYLDPAKANAFALVHAKGIYENQRKTTKEKRVLNLTRSGYASGQRYGTVLWSGDTCASWSNLKKQIAEGLNFAMSGMPYWTLDIGAFFTVGIKWQNRGCSCNTNPNPLWFWKGEYDEGVRDPAYRELYVRWLEYGTFLPMFRSHGTDTPREIWNFGQKGDLFYDAIEKFIRLRYHLMPYIYSLAGEVYLRNYTILRSLLFDFAKDQVAAGLYEEFMFGPALLVCTITKPMYYDKKGKVLEGDKIADCYLPMGTLWYDYWTGEAHQGGQWIQKEAPLSILPLFVKAGSIIPTAEGLQYAADIPAEPLKINVYPGADGSFVLYEDEGDNYLFEAGAYSEIPIHWNDAAKALTIGERKGSFTGMEKSRYFLIQIGDMVKQTAYQGLETVIPFPSDIC